jgi:Flp pilus assembly pilin Flp
MALGNAQALQVDGMEDLMTQFFNQFVDDESGQGITEYGAILAFVAVLVGLVFSFAQGQLASSISAAFSSVVSQLNQLAGAGTTSGGS